MIFGSKTAKKIGHTSWYLHKDIHDEKTFRANPYPVMDEYCIPFEGRQVFVLLCANKIVIPGYISENIENKQPGDITVVELVRSSSERDLLSHLAESYIKKNTNGNGSEDEKHPVITFW